MDCSVLHSWLMHGLRQGSLRLQNEARPLMGICPLEQLGQKSGIVAVHEGGLLKSYKPYGLEGLQQQGFGRLTACFS